MQKCREFSFNKKMESTKKIDFLTHMAGHVGYIYIKRNDISTTFYNKS